MYSPIYKLARFHHNTLAVIHCICPHFDFNISDQKRLKEKFQWETKYFMVLLPWWSSYSPGYSSSLAVAPTIRNPSVNRAINHTLTRNLASLKFLRSINSTTRTINTIKHLKK